MQQYADQLAVQMRKGTLVYFVLGVCGHDAVYANDIAKRLRTIGLPVVEGTIYAILSRLQKDGLLSFEWKASEQGPPRKYYRMTSAGSRVYAGLEPHMQALATALSNHNQEMSTQ
jgi:PadR family transcriptional regulator, regulatory protein PadR